MQVSEIMTAPVVTAALDAPVGEVGRLLGRHRISAVAVVDPAGILVGLVSEHDLLAGAGATAAEVMSKAVVTVGADTDVEDVRHLLVERRIGRVVVAAAGRPVGVVSRADVVATMVTEWVCGICGEPAPGPVAPAGCRRCEADGVRFVLHEQPPGS